MTCEIKLMQMLAPISDQIWSIDLYIGAVSPFRWIDSTSSPLGLFCVDQAYLLAWITKIAFQPNKFHIHSLSPYHLISPSSHNAPIEGVNGSSLDPDLTRIQ